MIPDVAGVSTLEDTEKTFGNAYLALRGSSYLIRPYGYIGYHAQLISEKGISDYLRQVRFQIIEGISD
jgi:hypothetical protein